MTDQQVQPCFFCGGENIQLHDEWVGSYSMFCECGAMGPTKGSIDEAIAAWNQRTGPTADQEYIAALEELLTRGAMAGYKVETESGREYGAIYVNDCRCCGIQIARDDIDATKPSTLRELVEVCRRRGFTDNW